MASAEVVQIIDPSLLHRPELDSMRGFCVTDEEFQSKKDKSKFRNYTIDVNDRIQERVRLTYLQMHTNQTVDFVRQKKDYWTRFDKAEMNIMDALHKLNVLVDESDPDVDVPNIFHAFQTAERIRKVYPSLDWFHLTGFIHDLGKVMALIGEMQWAVVGDTYPLGCQFADSIVYRWTSFDDNLDVHSPIYSTKFGMYSPNCGLDNVLMSWGHDEYLYQVLKNHPTCSLPQEARYIIRYHSFYPWHTGGDYMHLCNNVDKEMLYWVNEFNQFDLYTKSDATPDIEALTPYYQSLIDKYIPGKLKW
ncbi:hypothetical protein CHUAL_004456 [Chamberlinius hualienensis]